MVLHEASIFVDIVSMFPWFKDFLCGHFTYLYWRVLALFFSLHSLQVFTTDKEHLESVYLALRVLSIDSYKSQCLHALFSFCLRPLVFKQKNGPKIQTSGFKEKNILEIETFRRNSSHEERVPEREQKSRVCKLRWNTIRVETFD